MRDIEAVPSPPASPAGIELGRKADEIKELYSEVMRKDIFFV